MTTATGLSGSTCAAEYSTAMACLSLVAAAEYGPDTVVSNPSASVRAAREAAVGGPASAAASAAAAAAASPTDVSTIVAAALTTASGYGPSQVNSSAA